MDISDLKKAAEEQGAGEEQEKALNEMKKQMLRRVLTPEAMQRLARVRLANEKLAAQLELVLVRMVQSGQAQGQISDEHLKKILSKLTQKRETKIKRR